MKRYWLLICVCWLLHGCGGSMFAFSGIDFANGDNAICGAQENGNHYGNNNHLTSNMGVKYVVPVTKRINIVSQYTHHSCISNDDASLYDAVGIIGEVKLW